MRRATEFLNTFSPTVSEVFACNTNVSLGDRAHTFYVTLYTSKDTNPEDKQVWQRVAASMGRRVWNQMVSYGRQNGNMQGFSLEEDYGEGLGRLLTGINAALRNDVVSATMSHNLVFNSGTRFRFSHAFRPLLVSHSEALLENRQEVDLILNRLDIDKFNCARWADAQIHDYIHRPSEMSHICYYQFIMWYERHKWTGKELEANVQDAAKVLEENPDRFTFAKGHPGFKFIYLKKRDKFVIPKIFYSAKKMRGLSELEWKNKDGDATDAWIQRNREDHAKCALMLFYPFRKIADLKPENETYWKRFVTLTGAYDNSNALNWEDYGTGLPKERGGSETISIEPSFWPRGIRILNNMEERFNMETNAKRTRDPLLRGTEMKEDNGDRKKAGIDEEEVDYDVDIDDFDIGDLDSTNDRTFQVSKVLVFLCCWL